MTEYLGTPLGETDDLIRTKYHSRTLTGRFAQDDSRNNGDDSHADGADARKQAVMLSNIFLSNYD